VADRDEGREGVRTETFTYERGFADGQRRNEEVRRDLRTILQAWALGDADKMTALMLSAFLREFGKAPSPEVADSP
jgi:hypothetical protein